MGNQHTQEINESLILEPRLSPTIWNHERHFKGHSMTPDPWRRAGVPTLMRRPLFKREFSDFTPNGTLGLEISEDVSGDRHRSLPGQGSETERSRLHLEI